MKVRDKKKIPAAPVSHLPSSFVFLFFCFFHIKFLCLKEPSQQISMHKVNHQNKCVLLWREPLKKKGDPCWLSLSGVPVGHGVLLG